MKRNNLDGSTHVGHVCTACRGKIQGCIHSKSTFHLNLPECLLVAELALVSSTSGGSSCQTCHLSVVTMACSLASAEGCQEPVFCPPLRWSLVSASGAT